VSALGVEEQRVNVIVELSSPNRAAQALGDGYRVEVRVVLWQQDQMLKVPVASLFRQGDQWAAFCRHRSAGGDPARDDRSSHGPGGRNPVKPNVR